MTGKLDKKQWAANNTQNYSSAVGEALLKKSKLGKTWTVTKAPRDKATLNKAIKDLEKLISKEKKEAVQNYLEGHSQFEKQESRNGQKKAQLFLEHLSEVFQPFASELSHTKVESLVTILEYIYQPTLLIKAIKVKNMIKRHINIKNISDMTIFTKKSSRN